MSLHSVDPSVVRWGIVLGGYLVLLGTSGWVVKHLLSWADDEYPAAVSQQERDIGMLIGKAENALLLTLVLAGAYTGIAVIFAAKGLIRQEKIKNDDLYFFAGTFVNVTYSVLVGAGCVAALNVAGHPSLPFAALAMLA